MSAPHPLLRSTFSPQRGEKAIESLAPRSGERVAVGRVRGLILVVALFALATRAHAWGAGGVPDWVKSAANASLPAYPAGTPGVILLDDTSVSVQESGEIRSHHRVVCKILSTAGRDLGYATVHFDTLRRLAGFNAWSISVHGEEYEVRERDAVETSAAEGELYADQKVKIIKIPAADPGTVFAYEYETREAAPQAMQDSWAFQREVPVHSARYTLLLPNGWTHEERWFNAAAKAPVATGSMSTWEVTDVAQIKEEAGRPPLGAIAGRMAINFLSPTGVKTQRSWSDFGRWYNSLASARSASTPALQAKVRELTANSASTLDKIRTLASFAQRDIRYVAIEIGIGGYQPHAAGEIFSNRYGDCKDKVTALMSMLREIGVESYYLIVSTNRGVVDKEFPSVSGFNHAIIAIKLPQDVKSDSLFATIDHPKLGRLLIFDPTHRTVPLGHLPSYLQQNHGLLVAGDGGELIEMPAMKPERSQLVRTAKLSLDYTLKLSGTVTERRSGEIAANTRALFAQMTEAERVKHVEKTVSWHVADFKLTNVAIENLDDLSKDLVVRYELFAPTYVKQAGGLVLVRPRILGQKAETLLDLGTRAHGYETEGPSLQVDEVEIATPEGLAVEELPPAINVASPAVAYTSEAKFEGNVLRYRRQYKMQKLDVPLAELPELNKAFASILADERSSAVFKLR